MSTSKLTLASVAVFSCHFAHANLTQLQPLVVTATRSETALNQVPARISVLDQALLEQSPIASLPHLLMQDASLNMVQLGGMGQQASIFLRGTESDHTLVLRDGVRINNEAHGLASLNFIDTTDIEQIEILKGPASVLYGTHAIGGVVHMISKTPKENSAFVTAEVGEHQTYKTLVGVDIAEDNVYAQVRAQRLESDGTAIFPHDEARKSAYDQKGFSAKVGVEKDHYAVSVDHVYNEGFSAYENLDWVSYQYQPRSQTFSNQVSTLKARYEIHDALELNGRISRFKDLLQQQNVAEQTKFEADEYELVAKYQWTPQQQLTAGITQRNLSTQTNKPNQPFAKDITTTGYYLQHQYQSERLQTQAGFRVEQHDSFGTHQVGQVGARYHFSPHFSTYMNIGTAFKAPTLNDLYYGDYANANLKPEESISYELGMDHQINSAWRTGLSLYSTKIKHLIDSDPSHQWKLANIDQASILGAETYVHWQQGAMFSKLSYHYSKATNDQTDEDLSRRPRQKVSLQAGWQNPRYGINATLSANSQSDSSGYDDDIIPGHAQLDLHTYYQATDAIKLFANVQNLADVNYKMASAGNYDGMYYLSGGRLASVGITIKH